MSDQPVVNKLFIQLKSEKLIYLYSGGIFKITTKKYIQR